MNEKITREIAEEYIRLRSVDGGAAAIQQRLGFYPDHFRCQAYCEGYLEAIEKAKVLEEALKLYANQRFEVFPTITMDEKVAKQALTKWEEEK